MKKLNSMKLATLLVISTINLFAYSQNTGANSNNVTSIQPTPNSSSYNNTDSFVELVNSLQGNYQIQMLGIRTKPAIEQSLLMEIKEKQLASERVYFQYKENIRIMILSKEEILNGTIISDEEFIIYLN